jgi:beta-N-acetylhexosaminidase
MTTKEPAMQDISRRKFLALVGQIATLGVGAMMSRSAVARSLRPFAARDGDKYDNLDAMIAQMLLVGFTGSALTPGNPVIENVRTVGVGGVVLFDAAGNIQSPGQLKALTESLQRLARLPLLIAVDQEGGNVVRLKTKYGFPPTVSQQYLGEVNDLALTRRYADSTARTLAEHGINMNLAPVVDLNTNPTNPIIGAKGRSFSADPQCVVSHSLQVVRAHGEHKVGCAIKHFPGHGSANADSHLGFVNVTGTWSSRELEPFDRIHRESHCEALMTAHIYNARLDEQYPATLSNRTITGLLRGEMGYNGIVMTDDLQMKAITSHYSYPQAVELAVRAGADILTIGSGSLYGADTAARTVAIIKALVLSGAIPAERIEHSYHRILRLKGGLAA